MTPEVDLINRPDALRARTRRTLWAVLGLNCAIAIGFFVTGWLGESSALVANGLDNTADAVVYAMSLFVLGRAPRWKRLPRGSPAACCWSSPWS